MTTRKIKGKIIKLPSKFYGPNKFTVMWGSHAIDIYSSRKSAENALKEIKAKHKTTR